MTCRPLIYLADSIFSVRAWHTRALGEIIANWQFDYWFRRSCSRLFFVLFSCLVPFYPIVCLNSATQKSIINAHKKTQLTRARINCALKDSSCDSPLPNNLKLTILASNASSSLTKVFKCPHKTNDSIITQWFNCLKFQNYDQHSHSQI
ncbi:hypothetical protein H5410_031353 [Solanum commersonii]|uniref:Uncharacterized protein n=1 Tax=Solanum commersonii TaxID=4109 RepID=A0A9J5YJN1_SOLCO|nr:hypothetical protein H5410_031353 [Solanum commersonii]